MNVRIRGVFVGYLKNFSTDRLVLEQGQMVGLFRRSKIGRILFGNQVFDDTSQIFHVVTNVRDVTALNQLRCLIQS
ncbi:MAG: hypothetical protein PHI97_00015 [Desulfobulbus sp.]|nr:hypothetical protein [Desulfobulbus sp.]